MDNNNDIIKIFGINENGVKVKCIETIGITKTITIEKPICVHYCDLCGSRMYSKGIYIRHVNHPVLQDGYKLVFKIEQRRWMCTNKTCKHIETDEFSFVDKRRRNTNYSDILIVNAFRNPENSAAQIARMHHVSDSHVIRTFARYVDMHRRNLPEAICIDEVFLNIPHGYKYALVIQDFITGESIDLVETRRKVKTDPYFHSIPIKERRNVKYIISDMYKPYLEYANQYFPNAVNVVDAFHVIQAINHEYLKYIRALLHTLDEKDRTEHERREEEFHRKLEFKHSKDYLVLKKYNWMLLKNADKLKIYTDPRYNKYLQRYMTTFDYFEWMFKIDPALDDIRDLKELYISFNEKYAGDPRGAKKALPELIEIYRNCKYKMFHNIADILERNFDAIISSFILLEKATGDKARLSNGPIESLNRITKDMKRIGRGFRNFEFIRNRFLFATRENARILAVPKKLNETYLKAYLPHIDEEYTYDEDFEDNWDPIDD